MTRIARDAAVAEAVGPIVARYAEQRQRQSTLVWVAGAPSPTVLAHAALIDLAGTGDASQGEALTAAGLTAALRRRAPAP